MSGLFDYWEDRREKNTRGLLDWLLTIEGNKWHYLHGVDDPSRISPDNWAIDPKRNAYVYGDWQEYFHKHQPPDVDHVGKNEGIFTVKGAELIKRDILSAELYPRYRPFGAGRSGRSDRAVDA